MALLVLFTLASLLLVDGHRINVKKTSAKAAAKKEKEADFQELTSGEAWWDDLQPDCELCVKEQLKPQYSACKAGCKSRSYGDKAYYDCKDQCKGAARSQSLTDFKKQCASRCQADWAYHSMTKDGEDPVDTANLAAAVRNLGIRNVQLVDRIDDLEQRLADLEGGKKPAKPEGSSATITSSIIPDVQALQRGSHGGALVPALVPKAGETFEVMNFDEGGKNYHWSFISAKTGNHQEYAGSKYVGATFAKVHGGFSGKTFKPLVVQNANGEAIFNIQNCLTKTFRWIKSMVSSSEFCVTHPYSDQVMFTLSKDKFGRGWMFKKDEWRIFRGKKKDKRQLYYCVKSHIGKDHVCYKNEKDFERGQKEVAHASRLYESGPDKYSLKVEAGEDTALLLAATVTIDMVNNRKK